MPAKNAISQSLKQSISSSLDESASVQEKLRFALKANAVKIMDLFVEWDEDGDRQVSKIEFRRAMAALGFTHSRPHVDAVFDSLDEDKSGYIDFKEFNRGLKAKSPPASPR